MSVLHRATVTGVRCMAYPDICGATDVSYPTSTRRPPGPIGRGKPPLVAICSGVSMFGDGRSTVRAFAVRLTACQQNALGTGRWWMSATCDPLSFWWVRALRSGPA